MFEQLFTIILVAIVLGLDAFSLSMGMGIRGVTRQYEWKFSGTVGILHILMPLIGLSLGMAVGRFLGIWASRLGAVVLAYIALDFLIKGYRESKPESVALHEGRKLLHRQDRRRGEDWNSIFLLGISVSIDALTVGFSLGTLKMPLLITVLIMGLVAGSMTLLGFTGGRVFNRLVGSYAQMVGGLVLLLLAVKLIL
jgi:putative Mn2+ efflux pump MntP